MSDHQPQPKHPLHQLPLNADGKRCDGRRHLRDAEHLRLWAVAEVGCSGVLARRLQLARARPQALRGRLPAARRRAGLLTKVEGARRCHERPAIAENARAHASGLSA